jgi:hypothetical protein
MFLSVVLVPLAAAIAAEEPALPLLVEEDDFEKGADRWEPTDAKAWRIVQTEHGKVYNQFGQSKYNPPFRSPFNVSLLKSMPVGDFVLTAKVQTTNLKAGAHLDMCVFWGYQDPAHFYYVHLGRTPDPNSSQIMIVNGAPRKMITQNKSPGVPWDEKWHQVKVVRTTTDGKIEVYFDDMKKPMMTAVDKTFSWGRVGLGSFDDHGNWDDFTLHGLVVRGGASPSAKPARPGTPLEPARP